MSKDKIFPYVTRLDIKYGPLEIVDIPALAGSCRERWFNQTLCRVNDSVVRLGIIQGEYHWHRHEADDEFFFVIEGGLFVDLEERSFELRCGQGLAVPRGTVHRTRAPERTIILMVENAGIVPTGDDVGSVCV